MPFSSPSGKHLIDRAVRRILRSFNSIPHKVVDVGVGSGTYSHRYRKGLLRDWEWTGIEAWELYVDKYRLPELYDKLIIKGVLNSFDDLEATESSAPYGICFLGDVLEHMTVEQAQEVYEEMLDRCSFVIFSIPIGHYPQDEYEGNPFEKHVKDDWSFAEVYEKFRFLCFGAVHKEIGIFVGTKWHSSFGADLFKPQVAVYGICKNEEKFVDRMYQSIRDADEIVFCDTGSTDKTLEKLIRNMQIRENMGNNRMIVKQICVSPWRFDDARNAVLALISEDIDVCISIDVDEELAEGSLNELKQIVENQLRTFGTVPDRINHRFSTVWDWEGAGQNFTDHWHERIHSRKGFRWQLPVHEILVGEGKTILWTEKIRMTQKPDNTKSRSSYVKLLEQSVREAPKVWKSWTFLAGEYLVLGDHQKAIDCYHTAMALPDSDEAYCCLQLADVYAKLNKAMLCLEHSDQAASISATREYCFYAAENYLKFNYKTDARSYVLQGIAITTKPSGYAYNPRAWDDEYIKSLIARTE